MSHGHTKHGQTPASLALLGLGSLALTLLRRHCEA